MPEPIPISRYLIRGCDIPASAQNRMALQVATEGQTGVARIEVAFEVNEKQELLATVKDLAQQRVLVDRGARRSPKQASLSSNNSNKALLS